MQSTHYGHTQATGEFNMAHDVFISYSSKDKPIADAICAHLEGKGARCWIAPRDIRAGEDWPTAITKAIAQSRIMVLVFSASSNSSEDVSRELRLAARNKLVIIPFRIEDIEPEEGKKYYLETTHWLDAINPLTQEQINALMDCVKAVIPIMGGTNPPPPPPPPPPSKNLSWKRFLWIPGVLIALLGILVILALVTHTISLPAVRASNTAVPTMTPSATSIPPTTVSSTPSPKLTSTPDKRYATLTVGYADGCGSGAWSSAFSSSIKDSSKTLGVKLTYSPSNCNLNSQILSIQNFIAAKVAVIGVNAVGSGSHADWDPVLKKARDANIPVIFINQTGAADPSLFSAQILTDYEQQGRLAAQAMGTVLNGRGKVVIVSGPIGDTSAEDRLRGFLTGIASYPNISIIDTMNGDWSFTSGNQKMSLFINNEGSEFNGAFFANDDMALGGIQSIKLARKQPGVDIKVVSIDGYRAAFQAMVAGELSATVETNPLFGPLFYELAVKVANGEAIEKTVYQHNDIFYAEQAKEALPTRKY
jgi:galactofuranose transport system substrate-binding protein